MSKLRFSRHPAWLLVVITLLPAWSSLGAAGPATPLTIVEVLRLAATGSGVAGVAEAELAAAEAAVDRAGASRLPTVDLSAQYSMCDNPVEAQAGPLTFPTAEQASGQYTVEAREVLWDGGRRGRTIAAARAGAEATRLVGRTSVQRAQLDAVEAYLGALELAGADAVLAERRTAVRSHLAVVRDLFDHGLVARNDLLETEVRVREIEDQLAAVADGRALAAQDLNRRLGREPLAALALPDSLPEAPALKRSREELAAAAAERNPGLLAATARLQAHEAARDLARSGGQPSVFVGATHGYIENEFLVHQMFNAVVAGLRWNLFDGGARSAEVRQSAARVAAAAREQVEAARSAEMALDGAWRRWEQARREVKTAGANVDAARENLRLVEDQYGAGLARSGDVLDAEALLAQSRHDVVRRHYAAYRAQTELLIVAGTDAAEFYASPGPAPVEE